MNPDWMITKFWRTARKYNALLDRNILSGNDYKPIKVTVYLLGLIAMILITFTWYLATDIARKTWRSPTTILYGAFLALIILPLSYGAINWTSVYSKLVSYPTTGPDATACLSEYRHERYAEDPQHEMKLKNVLEKMGFMDSEEKIEGYIRSLTPSSPVNGTMVWKSSQSHKVDARLMLALMQVDSQFGTKGLAVKTKNPGNVGNDGKKIRNYPTWEAGVEAVAVWLSKNRKIISSAIRKEAEPWRVRLLLFQTKHKFESAIIIPCQN